MSALASLPMYNFPGMFAANQALWQALADRLRAQGIADVPERLETGAPPVPDAIAPHTLLTQTCGYPLQTIYSGQFRMLAVPSYDAAGCGAKTHRAFLVVQRRHGWQDLEDVRGRRFALNSLHSNSGMNLPRRLIAPLARDGRFFGSVIHTGGHPASLRHVRDGLADVASVDCLTWAFALDHAPDLVEGLTVLAQTAPSPAIPFITALATPPDVVAALRGALIGLGAEPQLASVRQALKLRAIDPVDPADYAVLLDYEREAADARYPQIV